MQIGLLELIAQQIYSFVAIGILLLISALIGGAETALSSLTHYDRSQLRAISGKVASFVEYLLKKPEQLLLTIMVANMACNTLIFTVSSLLVYRFIHAHHSVFASVIGIGTIFSLVLFSEIFSKAVIYYLRIPASIIVAGPIYILMRFFQIPLTLAEKIVITPLVRLIVGPHREHRHSKEELLTLFKISGEEKYLQPAQVDLLTKVAQLRDLRVRQVMIPRVNMPSSEIHEPVEKVKSFIRQTHRARIAVYVYQIDYIVGIIRSRRLLAEQPKNIREILERVKFVPENQRVDQLLHLFRREQIDVAMVVDEYGGLVGMVTLEELMEKTIGELKSEFPDPDSPKILNVGAGEYLVDGDFPLGEFLAQMKLSSPDVELGTVAGLVMHMAGHLPGINEVLIYQDVKLVVREIDSNRIEKILVLDKRKIYG